METKIGNIKTEYRARGSNLYSIEISHEGLDKHRTIRGSSYNDVIRKANSQSHEWNKKWDLMNNYINKKEAAEYLSLEAKKKLNYFKSILNDGLSSNTFTLETYKNNAPFNESKPIPIALPSPPNFKPIPQQPKEETLEFGKLNFFSRLFPSIGRRIQAKRERLIVAHKAEYKIISEAWEKQKKEIEIENQIIVTEYQRQISTIKSQNQRAALQWNKKLFEYTENQNSFNSSIDELQNDYENSIPDAICGYFNLVIDSSEYSDNFPKDSKLEYLGETKTLIVDFSLPSPTCISRLKEVKYIRARDELVEYYISQSEHEKLYDDVLYQIALRTIYEIFKADEAKVLQSIAFNGWVSTIDPSTGKYTKPCIMSLHVNRSDFMEINLANVNPKICFKALKGVGSSKLHCLAGIAPILQAPINDPRFVPSYDVTQSLDEGYNLATMDWEDFEHLIRELFEKEFSNAGSTVNVTQASRDGGVDAIIFNPDPIHGGKIVIQAKRYTNPVGVSAVRDLFGTVINEGANKGILVTTSDFGPDSYKFANGKPLILFNGGNLLHLLSKHGHRAKIEY